MTLRSIDYYKNTKFLAIDKKSSILINSGFTYENKVFSLSTSMQANLSTFIQMDNFAYIQYPVILSTLDNLDVISISNQAKLRSFYKAAFLKVSMILVAGNQIKQEVRDAATVDDVNAVIDPR